MPAFRFLRRSPLLILSVCLQQPAARAADATATQPATVRTVGAFRLQGGAPAIDGQLDDPCWAGAERAGSFVQTSPSPGEPATQQTEGQVVFDGDAVYVAMRMFDSAPDSVAGQLARRDFTGYSDWAGVILDSYHDRRTAFRFTVNPKGVQKDVLHWNDTNEDLSWDAVWQAAARVDSLGWTAEFRIPLSQLRFSSSGNGVWGVNFWRVLARRNERTFWSYIPPGGGAMVSKFGELTGMADLHARRHLELLPYSLGRITQAPGDPLDPFYDHTEPFAAAGADLKYGVTSDITLTATLNPDFGQVEADPSVVNLTAFETFFPEKRPFFIEGASIFRGGENFPYSVRDGRFGNDQLFYSRRIGRRPQGFPPFGATYMDMPDATTILGAAKFSGKTKNGWSIGTLDAVTAEEHSPYVDGVGVESRAAVEPLTNYAVARLVRDFNRGGSALGVIGTAVNRNVDDEPGLDFLRSAAYAGGFDLRHRFSDSRYELAANARGSRVEGSAEAIVRTQLSPARYYQRPDATHVAYDPTRTSLSGVDSDVSVSKIGGDDPWRFWVVGHARSPGFEVNDLGFMQSADWLLEGAYLGYQHFKPAGALRSWNINANEWSGWTFGGERRTTGVNTNWHLETTGNWFFDGSIDHEFPALAVTALRGGPALQSGSYTNMWLGFISDNRHPLTFTNNFSLRQDYETGSHEIDLEPLFDLRPSARVQLGLYPGFNSNQNKVQYVQQTAAADATTRYLFATIDQRTAWLTARVSYSFTPSLSLQFYGQPFLSGGTYSSFKEVDDPGAGRFADRFHAYSPDEITYDGATGTYAVDRDRDGTPDYSFGNPNFSFREFRSNTVLRWEYHPGSTLYLVWSQGRTGIEPDGRLRLGHDFGRLFDTDATNVLLLKVSYWIDV